MQADLALERRRQCANFVPDLVHVAVEALHTSQRCCPRETFRAEVTFPEILFAEKSRSEDSATKRPMPSVLSMLMASSQAPSAPSSSNAEKNGPQKLARSEEEYGANVMQKITSKKHKLCADVWVTPTEPFQKAADINRSRRAVGQRPIDADEALALVQRPLIFVWAPELSCPRLQIHCPNCGARPSTSRWWRQRTLHTIGGNAIYITRKYTCHTCHKTKRGAKATFMGDSAGTLATLPKHVAALWDLFTTGRILCDATVVDFVRSMATWTSWQAIADTMTELKAQTWMKRMVLRYLRLCEMMEITPERMPTTLPADLRVANEGVRNAFLQDGAARKEKMGKELKRGLGDEVLVLDWTRGVTTRCSGYAVSNAMDAGRGVLLSRLTATCGPWEARSAIDEFADRSVCPKVVYVDDECCGAWATLIANVWPNAVVRLDGMHAIMRLKDATALTLF